MEYFSEEEIEKMADKIRNAEGGEIISIPCRYDMKELEELSKPLVEWLKKNSPYHKIEITTSLISMTEQTLGIPLEVED